MKRHWTGLLTLLILLNGIGLVVLYLLAHAGHRSNESRIETQSLLSLTGKQLVTKGAHCRVIHYTAKSCHFCQQENHVWLGLKFGALARNCDVVAVVPNVTELDSAAEADTALFVSPVMASGLNATRTPTTAITDETGTVRWFREGAITESDQRDGLAIVHQFTSDVILKP